jgi:probable O-glycosylation ligase (exosortase A-associated)
MKQYLVLVAMSAAAVLGSFITTPFWGVAVYYAFCVLRPQYLWKWQLISAPVALPWSFIAAGSAIGGYLAWVTGLLSFGGRATSYMRYRPAYTIAHWGMTAFAAQITLSYIFSNNHDQSEAWYGEYLKIFVMYFVASRVIRTPRQIWAAFVVVACGLFFVAFELNMIYFQTRRLTIARDGFAGLDNNGAGLLIALGVPLCFFAWEACRGWYRWLFLVMIPFNLHMVVSSYSRGAMASTLAVSALYFFYSRKKRFLLGCFAATAVAIPFLAGKEIQERFNSIEKRDEDGSWQIRLASWAIAVEIANDYPLVGAGVRCSNGEMKSRGADMENRTIHNLYLQIAADSGWPALMLYAFTALATIYCCWRTRIRLWHRTDPEAVRAVALVGGLECSVITFLLGATFLSLEVFEVAYVIMLLAAQVWGLVNCVDTAPPQAASVAVGPVRMNVPQRVPVYANAGS